MTSQDRTGLTLEEHGTTLVARIDGGEHALLTPALADDIGRLVRRVDKDPDVHAVVFTGAHPDRFLSHADVSWLQEGGVGFPSINTRTARAVARMAKATNRTPGLRSLAARTRLKTLLQLDSLHATLLKMNASGTIFIAALNGSALAIGAEQPGRVRGVARLGFGAAELAGRCARVRRGRGAPGPGLGDAPPVSGRFGQHAIRSVAAVGTCAARTSAVGARLAVASDEHLPSPVRSRAWQEERHPTVEPAAILAPRRQARSQRVNSTANTTPFGLDPHGKHR
jgi:hypothetical protein